MNLFRHFGFFLIAIHSVSVFAGGLPDWVLNPPTEEGMLAGADCVRQSGLLMADRQQAIANARTQIAQQIETRVSSLDEVVTLKVESAGKSESQSSFKSVSKQLAEQSLANTRIARVEQPQTSEGNFICVLVQYGKEAMRTTFKSAVAAVAPKMDPADEATLFRSFVKVKNQ